MPIPPLWSIYDRIPDETEDVIAKLYSLPWYFKLTWIFYCIATAASVLVTVMFFAALWPQMDHKGGIGMENLQLHGINSDGSPRHSPIQYSWINRSMVPRSIEYCSKNDINNSIYHNIYSM
jgi:hypothetical protein